MIAVTLPVEPIGETLIIIVLLTLASTGGSIIILESILAMFTVTDSVLLSYFTSLP